MSNQPTSISSARNKRVSDEELMLAFKKRNASGFEVLYKRYKAPLYRYISGIADANTADDCFQETWMKVINSRKTYKEGK